MHTQDSSRTRTALILALIGIVVVFLFSIVFFYLSTGNKTPSPSSTTGTQHAPTITHIAFPNLSPTATPTSILKPPTIANAGFETPALGNSYQYNVASNAWSFSGSPGNGSGITGNQSDFTDGNPNAPEGVQVAFIQGTGTISQTLQFTAGKYIVSFQAAQRVQYQHGGEDFKVLIDDTVVGNFFPADINYAISASTSFSVTTGAHVLTFQGIDSKGGDNTAFIDAINITPA